MTGRIPLWIDLRHVPVNKRLPYLHAVEEMAAEHLVLEKGDPHLDRKTLHPVALDGKLALREGGRVIGRLVRLHDAKSQEKAAQAQGIVVVDAADWQVIPLENLIAARAGRPGTLYALARSAEQAALFADTLELGVHGIVLAPASTQAIFEADRLLRERHRPGPPARPLSAEEAAALRGIEEMLPPSVRAAHEKAGTPLPPAREGGRSKAPAKGTPLKPRPFLEPARVTEVGDGGVGDRVCVDTTSLFRDGEGLLVGSTARSFALVHAETEESEFVRARPFRVNAGAVHSYLYAPEGKTCYLAELRSGQPVLAIHPDGIHRVVSVGRVKIERRPHTLIRWRTADGRDGMAVLQTAETVHLVRPDGKRAAVTALKPGDTILVHNEVAARHFGMPVESRLEER